MIGTDLDVIRHGAIVTRERSMTLLFAIGSACFLISPFPGHSKLVGERADSVTFFVGSILFTGGGALQSITTFPERHSSDIGRAAWWAAAIQSAGTLFGDFAASSRAPSARPSRSSRASDERVVLPDPRVWSASASASASSASPRQC